MFMSFTMTEVLGRLRRGPIRQPRCQILRFSVLQTTAGPRKTKETFLDSSEMGRAPIGSSIGLSLTRRTGSLGQGSHVWISQSRPSCTAFSGHRLMCAAVFLVMEAGEKKLLEDAIRQPDLAKRVQRCQLAVDKAKVRLDLAATPGAWLMPSHMAINTERTVAYNNKLRQATPNINLWFEQWRKQRDKKSGVTPHGGGPSKTNPPNNHPSNPIHKEAMKVKKESPTNPAPSLPPEKATTSHHINKAMLAVGAVFLTGL